MNYLKLKDENKSDEYFEISKKLDSKYIEFIYNEAQYYIFKEKFDKAKKVAAEGMERNKPILTEVKCEECNSDRKMHLRTNQNGQFLGCEGYLEEGDKQCKKTYSLLSDELFTDNDDKEAESIFNKAKCDLCGSSMDGYIIDETKKLLICANSPICSGTKFEIGNFIKPKNGEEELIDCHKCDSKMELKLGRFGKYFSCQSESCTATRQLMKNGKIIFIQWIN